MKGILLITLAVISLTTSCKSADTFDLYKDEMSELLKDPKTRLIKGIENDVNDLGGCHIDFELGKWKPSNGLWNGVSYGQNVWSRYSSSLKVSGIVSSGNFYLDFSPKESSSFIIKQKDLYLIYIGPWKTVNLSHMEGFFPFYKTITEQKQIRFFAYYPKEGGDIQYQYESKTEENENIYEKKFSLSPAAKYAPDKFGLCVVKWTANFGYNAVAEVKSKNPFSSNYLVPTGKIIEVEE